MKRKLIARNKLKVTGVLRYARRNSLTLREFIPGRIRAQIRMMFRHQRRCNAALDLAGAKPWISQDIFLIHCVSWRGHRCKHTFVTSEKLEEMRNA
ncbi:TPA: hypothetical protein O3G95_004717 [Salmonella enterica subsp. enterica serovar Saintpaul str. CFSAN004147]|nr:hypothetical protein [Salmonella enterica subsp. enterica serovar Saintpaul str. CFSAN004147]HCZ5289089.1 hypothetical protein [Salmonella enterica subsp. enterica serovar Saintpaul str. CFSAN004154]